MLQAFRNLRVLPFSLEGWILICKYPPWWGLLQRFVEMSLSERNLSLGCEVCVSMQKYVTFAQKNGWVSFAFLVVDTCWTEFLGGD